jgi:hypothetical protein
MLGRKLSEDQVAIIACMVRCRQIGRQKESTVARFFNGVSQTWNESSPTANSDSEQFILGHLMHVCCMYAASRFDTLAKNASKSTLDQGITRHTSWTPRP